MDFSQWMLTSEYPSQFANRNSSTQAGYLPASCARICAEKSGSGWPKRRDVPAVPCHPMLRWSHRRTCCSIEIPWSPFFLKWRSPALVWVVWSVYVLWHFSVGLLGQLKRIKEKSIQITIGAIWSVKSFWTSPEMPNSSSYRSVLTLGLAFIGDFVQCWDVAEYGHFHQNGQLIVGHQIVVVRLDGAPG